MPRKVLPVGARHVLGNMLARVHEVEPRHFPYHEEDIVDWDASDFVNGLRQARRELALLLLGPPDANVTGDDRHLSSPLLTDSALMMLRARLGAKAGEGPDPQLAELLF